MPAQTDKIKGSELCKILTKVRQASLIVFATAVVLILPNLSRFIG